MDKTNHRSLRSHVNACFEESLLAETPRYGNHSSICAHKHLTGRQSIFYLCDALPTCRLETFGYLNFPSKYPRPSPWPFRNFLERLLLRIQLMCVKCLPSFRSHSCLHRHLRTHYPHYWIVQLVPQTDKYSFVFRQCALPHPLLKGRN